MAIRLVFALVTVMSIVTLNLSLIAYDCRHPVTNITAISLRDVGHCPDPTTGYNVVKKNVQILQRRMFDRVRVRSCLMEVTRIIMHCGMHSHNSIVHQGVLTYVHAVGAHECHNMHRFRNYQGFPGQAINQLVLNGTTTASVVMAGHADINGRCAGSIFIENGISWKDVVVTATVKIQLMDYLAKVKLGTDLISLQGGITCPFTEGYCTDTVAGENTWELQQYHDCEQYDALYTGPAYMVSTKATTSPVTTYVVVEQKDRVFAISLRSKDEVCGMNVWSTEHPKLMVVDSYQQSRLTGSLRKRTEVDLTAYTNSKFLYVEQAYKRAIDQLYADAVYRRCLLRREVLLNRLLTAPLTPNAVSAIIKNRLGYVGRMAGEVLYILQCIPRVVQIRRVTECYHEQPVKANNESLFMSPITRILQRNGEQTECNALIPPVYHIDGQWVGFTPAPTFGLEPIELPVDTEPELKFKPIQNLGTGGLYTEDEIQTAQEAIMFGLERAAVSNILTRKMAGLEVDSQGTSALNLFNKKELEQIAKSTIRQLWGWFEHLRIFTSGILGIYFMIRVIKSVIEIILNGVALHRVAGCGLSMVACLWDTVTVWTIHNYHRRVPSQEAPIEQVELSVISSPGEIREDAVCEEPVPNREGQTEKGPIGHRI